MKEDLFTVQPFEGIDDYAQHPSVAEIELQMILEPNNPVAQALGWDCWFLTNQTGIDWIKEKIPALPFESGLASEEDKINFDVVILPGGKGKGINHKILYAIILMKTEKQEKITLETLAKDFDCSPREIANGIDKLKDVEALNWSLSFDGSLDVELLADIQLINK